jgi:hypothetical protein
MNAIKKYAGLVWMLIGPLAIYYLVKTAAGEIEKKPMLDTWIQWGVFTIVALPIAAGMVIFGYYAWQGEYDHLPEESDKGLIH